MKTYTDYLLINTNKQKEIINITQQIREAVKKSGVKEGMALVNSIAHIGFEKVERIVKDQFSLA